MDFEDIVPMVGMFIFIVILLPLLIFSLPEVVSEEKIEVTATITDTHHSFPMGGPYVYKAADYDIYFEYDGIKGSWDVNSDVYYQYEDKIGEPIKCYLITRVYDNGKAELKLVAVDDYEERN
jgi:hypothetical protein